MISDVLSDAVHDINDYLAACPDAYPKGDALTDRIERLRDEMTKVRRILDTPPKLGGEPIASRKT